MVWCGVVQGLVRRCSFERCRVFRRQSCHSVQQEGATVSVQSTLQSLSCNSATLSIESTSACLIHDSRCGTRATTCSCILVCAYYLFSAQSYRTTKTSKAELSKVVVRAKDNSTPSPARPIESIAYTLRCAPLSMLARKRNSRSLSSSQLPRSLRIIASRR